MTVVAAASGASPGGGHKATADRAAPAIGAAAIGAARTAAEDERRPQLNRAARAPLGTAQNSALSARAGLHWRGRLVELVLPALFPPLEDTA